MIVVDEIKLNPANKTAQVILKADTKSEVTSSAEIIGLPEGYELAPFSTCFTAEKDLGVLKSDGTWNWD